MGWFEETSYEAQAYQQVLHNFMNNSKSQALDSFIQVTSPPLLQVQTAPHKAALSHELIAGAAAYEAAKAYENHVSRNGHPDSHAKAKEIVAGFAGAFIDRVVETKGLDFIDSQKAKYHARQQTHERLEVDYTSNEYIRTEEYSSNY